MSRTAVAAAVVAAVAIVGAAYPRSDKTAAPPAPNAEASAVLATFARDGSIVAFDKRAIAEVAGGYLAVGTHRDVVVAYFCDGARGVWFVGTQGHRLEAGDTSTLTVAPKLARATLDLAGTARLATVDLAAFSVDDTWSRSSTSKETAGVIGRAARSLGVVAPKRVATTSVLRPPPISSATITLGLSPAATHLLVQAQFVAALKSIQRQLADLEAQRQAIQAKITSTTQQLSAVPSLPADQISALQAQLATLQQMLATVNDEIKQILQQVDALEQQAQNQQATIDSHAEIERQILLNLNQAADSYARILEAALLPGS
jgi:flagellar biosynthesis chaperone FliJ